MTIDGSTFIALIAGLGPPGSHVSRQAADPEVQAEHADQQGAHAAVRRREPLQVSRQGNFLDDLSLSFEPGSV